MNEKQATVVLAVDNIKCGGCGNSISQALQKIVGVDSVQVTPSSGEVQVTFTSKESEQLISNVKEQLMHLGYPLTGTISGLGDIALKAKSFLSCAIGSINNVKTQ